MSRVYLSNADFWREIHLSKSSYCAFRDPAYATYHAIVGDLALITADMQAEIIAKAAKPRGKVVAQVLTPSDLIWRVPSMAHVPLDPGRRRYGRQLYPITYAKTNFPPFSHYRLEDGRYVEVGRSHWRGDLETGDFNIDHGELTPQLGAMLMLLTQKYSMKWNWRSYSYRDEMAATALMQLCYAGLSFDESKSDNPFAYLTQICTHAFIKILRHEKAQHEIRDTMLADAGLPTSMAHQITQETDGVATGIKPRPGRPRQSPASPAPSMAL